MDSLFDMRPDRPGYRLQRLEVFNWGTFDSSAGQIYCFEPDGRTALLVGHNGSGKSTLVDSILTLLVDSRTRNYNVAAGAGKRERTAKSYIKGAFDRTANESHTSSVRFLRPVGNHLSAVSAVFHDEQLGKSFTLTQILYLKADSDDKVFAIADTGLHLDEVLPGLQKSDQIREHLSGFGYQTTKTYIEYQRWLTRRTHMRGKAIDMFNQTVAVKDIQSLNKFVRDHMLEARDWRERVQKILTHFEDLSVAHQELVRARRAEAMLSPVETRGEKFRKKAAELESLERQIAAAEIYFPTQLILLFEPEIEVNENRIDQLIATVKRLDREIEDKNSVIYGLTEDINREGGERLRKLPDLIELEQTHLQHKQPACNAFHENLAACAIQGTVNSEVRFEKAQEHVGTVVKSSRNRIADLESELEDAIGVKREINAEITIERDELNVLQQRRTNLPPNFAAMRTQICHGLQLDETMLPFAAELIAVDSQQHEWEASIEMVLYSFARSLLVPDRFYEKVRRFVEQNRIVDKFGKGQRLEYIRVEKVQGSAGDRVHPNAIVHKLEFKPRHDLSPWVRGEVQRRFKHQCCDTVEEFNDISAWAVTVNRHVKATAGRHQKDDRDRTVNPRYFVLGWDNTAKKERIARQILTLEEQLEAVSQKISNCQTLLTAQRKVLHAAAEAQRVSDFDRIDVARHERTIKSLKEEKRLLEESNDTVRELKRQLKAEEKLKGKIVAQRQASFKEQVELQLQVDAVKKRVEGARQKLKSAESEDGSDLADVFDTITEALGEPQLSFDDFSPREQEWKDETRAEIRRLREPVEELRDSLLEAMVKYLREFKEEQDDLSAAVQSLDSFLALLRRLRREDLPRYEDKFKERLNDQVSQEIGLFHNALREERRQIERKIEQLNEALSDVVYNPGTFMRLQPRQVQDREIDDFRRSLAECLADSMEHTDEANQARFSRIQKLVERLGDKERTTWRNKVIDVRNWYDFAAQEVERETQTLKSCYDGSSGQSGGEKAKLAFTILVAALAYQFDIDPNGDTPGRFQFVVVDEMFSKVDDQNAMYALRLFQQFGLQLLIVAPLDAKARVTEPFVDRYLHVVKDTITNCSQLYNMTAEDYNAVVKQVSVNP